MNDKSRSIKSSTNMNHRSFHQNHHHHQRRKNTTTRRIDDGEYNFSNSFRLSTKATTNNNDSTTFRIKTKNHPKNHNPNTFQKLIKIRYFPFLFLLFMIGAMISITLFSFKGEIIKETNGEEFKKKFYPDRKFYASDGTEKDSFGKSCSIVSSTTKDKEKESFMVVVGTGGTEAAAAAAGAHYVFQLDGTELHKLSSAFPHHTNGKVQNNKKKNEEKIKITVRAMNGAGVGVFSPLDGNFEREINVCEDKSETNNKDEVVGEKCYSVFQTHEDSIVISRSNENGILYIYNTNNGKLLHKINITEGGSSSSHSSTERIQDVAISDHLIISTTQSKTYVYSYSYYDSYGFLPSFFSSSSFQIKKVAEISKGGTSVATSGDRIVITNYKANLGDGMAFLYTTDGTLMRKLYRYDSTSESYFGFDVDMNHEKIVIGAPYDDHDKGSVFLYSTKTGQFVGKKKAHDAENGDHFGASVCVVSESVSSSFYVVVGATGVDDKGRDSGAAYLVSFSSDDILEMDK